MILEIKLKSYDWAKNSRTKQGHWFANGQKDDISMVSQLF